MKLTLDALMVLDAIDRRGSFSAASEQLNRVPSALTYTVRKLEDDLDVLLFDRSGHRAKLTPAGRELLEQGRLLLNAAQDLECRVKRVATGWETELRIAVDGIIPLTVLYPLLSRFYAEGHATRIRLSAEVLGGSWEAMRVGRADLVLGAPGDSGAAGGDFRMHALGDVEMLLAMAPQHPLAKLPEPLREADLRAHRIVAVADSSRVITPRTVGILEGQDTLTVPDMPAKIDALIMGLGIGRLARYVVQPLINSGKLVVKETEAKNPLASLNLLAPKRADGKACKWWIETLRDPVWWQSWQEACALRAPQL